jgi:hypothetical protein
MLRGDAPREAPPPTVHNTVVSFGSGQFYPADGRIFAALEPPPCVAELIRVSVALAPKLVGRREGPCIRHSTIDAYAILRSIY